MDIVPIIIIRSLELSLEGFRLPHRYEDMVTISNPRNRDSSLQPVAHRPPVLKGGQASITVTTPHRRQEVTLRVAANRKNRQCRLPKRRVSAVEAGKPDAMDNSRFVGR
jgi:hypothetical protein